MSRSTTRILNTRKFAAKHGAATIVKLMMACNDLSLANNSMARWKDEQSPARSHRKHGARIYFMRLQISHLVEALKIIDEITSDPILVALVECCDRQTQLAFAQLREFRKGGGKHSEFVQSAELIRHNLGFHYEQSAKLISTALSKRVKKYGDSPSTLTRGSEMMQWNFQLADEVHDRIVVREIWKIPEEASNDELRQKADDKAMWIHNVMLTFVDFAAEFVWKFSEVG